MVVALSLAAAGSAPSALAAGPGVTTGIAWKDCGKQLQCARVRVPLDWSQPGMGTISLAYQFAAKVDHPARLTPAALRD